MSGLSSVTIQDSGIDEKFGFPICCIKGENKKMTSKCLQHGNNSKFALFVLSFVFFFQGFLVNGIINVVYSTIEKRFFLRSSETGFIASCYDIGFCVASVVVSIIWVKCHKPIFMACGIFLMGLSAILFSLPHFVATRYTVPGASYQCNTTVTCDENLRAYRGFFISSQLLLGMAAAPLLAFAPVYLDENVKKNHSSTYNGILYASLFVGAGVGFLVGGALLSTFTNTGENVSITTESTNWIGNWWAGFIVGGAILILLSLPTSMFPQRMSKIWDSVQRDNENGSQRDDVRQRETMNRKKRLLVFLQPYRILLQNKTFIFITILVSMDVGLVSSLATFGPKYVETMFGLTASDSALYFGILSVCCAMVGNLIGGFVITKLTMDIKHMIIHVVICSILSFGFYFGFFYRCADVDIIGVTSPFHGEQTINCTSTCGGCSTTFYQPICGADGRTYESLCAAGCIQSDDMLRIIGLWSDSVFDMHSIIKGLYRQLLFTMWNVKNCSRVLDSEMITTLEHANATNKVCSETSCSNLALFMILIAMSVLIGFLKVQATLQITLRCVPSNLKTFALALQLLIVRLIGSIPLPIIFGSVLDLACIIWGLECNECGSCQAYSNASMSSGMALVGVCSKMIGIFSAIAMWKTYTPIATTKSVSPESNGNVSTTITEANLHIEEYEIDNGSGDIHTRTEHD